MKKSFQVFLVGILLTGFSLILFHKILFSFGQSLYLAVIEDPSPRLSLYPWLVESSRQLRAGYFPLWCSLEGLGFPLLANYQSTPLNPFNLLFTLFPYLKFLDFILILKLLLLGIFTFLFALELGLSAPAGALSAFVICFCGYTIKNLNMVLINSELWLPLALLFIEKSLRNKPRFKYLLGISLSSWMSFVGGNPQVSFYFLVFIGLYLVIRVGIYRWRVILMVLLSLGLGLIWASYQVFPFIEYLGYSWHLHGTEFYRIGKPPFRYFYSLFFPWVYGPHRSYYEQLFMREYIGLIAIFLALLSLTKGARLNRKEVFFWTYLIIFLGVIYWIAPFHLIHHLGIFRRVANIKYAYFGVCFSIAILAGFGLDEYLNKKKLSARRFAIGLGLTVGLAFLAIFAVYKFPPHSIHYQPFRSGWLEPLALFAFASAVGLYGILFEERRLCGAMLAFLVFANLAHLFGGFRINAQINPLRWRFFQPTPPTYLLPILREQKPARFICLEGAFHHNYNLIFGINDLRVFEAMYPKTYVEVMGEIEGFGIKDAVRAFFEHGWSFDVKKENLGSHWLDEMGIKYLISPREISAKGWELLQKYPEYYLYINTDCFPRIWLVKDGAEKNFHTAELINYLPQKAEIKLKQPSSGWLVFADQYAPGWRAYLLPQKKEVRIFPEKKLFRKVRLEPGMQKLEFIYQPTGFRLGLWISLAGGFFLLVIITFWLRQTRKSLSFNKPA